MGGHTSNFPSPELIEFLSIKIQDVSAQRRQFSLEELISGIPTDRRPLTLLVNKAAMKLFTKKLKMAFTFRNRLPLETFIDSRSVAIRSGSEPRIFRRGGIQLTNTSNLL